MEGGENGRKKRNRKERKTSGQKVVLTDTRGHKHLENNATKKTFSCKKKLKGNLKFKSRWAQAPIAHI